MDKKITIAQIKEVAQQAYDLYKTNTDGKNADYIPYLAKKDAKREIDRAFKARQK